MTYSRDIAIEFNHCDPAGIVFYPRYFEMTNSVVENFFRSVVGFSFARMMDEGLGVPTARIHVDFLAPSRLGETLAFTLAVTRLGRTSVTFRIAATSKDERRLEGVFTLVHVNPQGRPASWPDAMRAPLAAHLERSEP